MNAFETECIWDHFYVFDGDSVYSPLVAAYSGIYPSSGPEILPEITTHSGKAFLYFYSDAAYNMSGFNFTYTVNGCPHNCSTRGQCVGGRCFCTGPWEGQYCQLPLCKTSCQHGSCSGNYCICEPGYTGRDCSILLERGWWEAVPDGPPRALHAALVARDSMWVVGGLDFFHQQLPVVRFDFTTKQWKDMFMHGTQPLGRSGHSLVHYQDKLYMYGGQLSINGSVVAELWSFDLDRNTWKLVLRGGGECAAELCSPLEASGHTATLVGDLMVVVFGHHPTYGYLNTVQHYNFSSGQWELVATRGAIVKGGYGHSSTYDRVTQRIYVYGGYHSTGTEAALTDFIYAYNPWERVWMILTPSQSPRYLHASVFLHGLILVIGGTTRPHNDQCFSSEILTYDIVANSWQTLTFPSTTGDSRHIGRYGHAAVAYNDTVYVFGGFNGEILGSMYRFTPGRCEIYHDPKSCSAAAPGVKCVWQFEQRQCKPFSLLTTTVVAPPRGRALNLTALCGRLTSCPSCLENTFGCVWCGSGCQHARCHSPDLKLWVQEVRDTEQCEPSESSNCDKLHNCHACHTEYRCGWQHKERCINFVRDSGNSTTAVSAEEETPADGYRAKCELPCHLRTSCINCTEGPCMWCSGLHRCVEANSYPASFPLGQCMEWTTHPHKCPGLDCGNLQSCEQCQQNPHCGWCDGGQGTGLGRCMRGSDTGPLRWDSQRYVPDTSLCSRWHFTSCPLCQCNGHSSCVANTSLCIQPCRDLTEGSNCQQCMAGYYGNPVNGGNCTACFCHGHGDLCQRDTGTCYCTTKGINGKHCNRCDETNHYVGNPSVEGGSCFYILNIDFQYTFNMSKAEDRYYTSINFMNTPSKSDVDVDFTLSCSERALANISVASSAMAERMVRELERCEEPLKVRFSHAEHLLGVANTTFYVYVFGFNTPLMIQVSFSQHRTLDLLQFFITFSSCFLTLLVLAAGLWKVKQKYDLYRRRQGVVLQRLFVELEQMASRPFATVSIEIDRDTCISSTQEDGRKKNHPTPIALEPLADNRAAILSLILVLPSGDDCYTPVGQSGLAIASALVSLGGFSGVQGNKAGCMDRSDLLHGQDTTTTSVVRYCDQGAWTDLICSMDKTPPPQLAGIVIRVHGPI
ncbi:ATRN [Cordylochernes scorpioides]|uniref:ATRN n=1 Tax=Cordylochernes scorpioides TaxID=51811 RepID=A0ABY6KXB7_9ARAC|nr:ATRN [Cordylochernes scorpioides]